MACVIAEIRDEGQSGGRVAPLVQRAVLLATVLRTRHTLDWLKTELGGYAHDATLPNYRRGDGGVLIAWRPGDGWIQAPIAPALASRLSHFELRTGVEDLETQIEEQGPRGAARMEFDGDELAALQQEARLDTRLSLALPQTAIPTVLETVRQGVIAWANAMLEAGVEGEGSAFTREERARAEPVDADFHSLVEAAAEHARAQVAASSARRRGFLSRLFAG